MNERSFAKAHALATYLGFALVSLTFVALVAFDWSPRFGTMEAHRFEAHSGDEPHYMITISSLLEDRDLVLTDDYDAAYFGSEHAGTRFRNRLLDHHTILVDPSTGDSALWARTFDPSSYKRCQERGCNPFEYRPGREFPDGPNVYETPAHPPAFAALLFALIAPFVSAGPGAETAAGLVVMLLGFAAMSLTYVATYNATRHHGIASLAAALLVLASPFTSYAKGYFPESTVGLCFIAGLVAMQRQRPVAAALSIALAMFIKPHFVTVGGFWIIERWMARDRRSAIIIAAVMTAAGVALILFNASVLGRIVVAGTVGWVGSNTSSGTATSGGTALPLVWIRDATRILTNENHGLLVFVPWAAAPIWACRTAFARNRERPVDSVAPDERLLRLVGPTCLANFVLLVAFGGGLGGSCLGPRYWIAYLPWLAAAAGIFVWRATPWARWGFCVLACVGAAISLPIAVQYSQVWNRPASTALSRMLPRVQPPVGTIEYSPLNPKTFRLQRGKQWVYANGKIVPQSSLYNLVTGHSRRPKLRRKQNGDWPYVCIN